MKSLNIIYLSLLALTFPKPGVQPTPRHGHDAEGGMAWAWAWGLVACRCRFHAASSLCHATGLDPRYAEENNPLTPDAANLAAGRTLYRQYCASCHGIDGLGDGDAGKALQPPPANLAWSTKRPIATDGYLDWTIAEGGVPDKTAMPAFKDVLSEHQIWQIILYLRQLLRLPFAIGPSSKRRRAQAQAL